MVTPTCLAVVQVVEPRDVLLAHLGGRAELDAGVGDGLQGRLVVLGESVPEKIKKRK